MNFLHASDEFSSTRKFFSIALKASLLWAKQAKDKFYQSIKRQKSRKLNGIRFFSTLVSLASSPKFSLSNFYSFVLRETKSVLKFNKTNSRRRRVWHKRKLKESLRGNTRKFDKRSESFFYQSKKLGDVTSEHQSIKFKHLTTEIHSASQVQFLLKFLNRFLNCVNNYCKSVIQICSWYSHHFLFDFRAMEQLQNLFAASPISIGLLRTSDIICKLES